METIDNQIASLLIESGKDESFLAEPVEKQLVFARQHPSYTTRVDPHHRACCEYVLRLTTAIAERQDAEKTAALNEQINAKIAKMEIERIETETKNERRK